MRIKCKVAICISFNGKLMIKQLVVANNISISIVPDSGTEGISLLTSVNALIFKEVPMNEVHCIKVLFQNLWMQ